MEWGMAIGQTNNGVGKGIQEKRRERATDKQLRKLV
jgi:hypothetical protein